MNDSLRGATRSKTVYLGLLLTVLGYVQANLPTLRVILATWVPPELIELVMGMTTMLLGLAVIAVRFVTDRPLADKAP